MNTLSVPVWLKRETVAIVLDTFGLPCGIAQQATDEEIEQIIENLAEAFSESRQETED